MKKLAWCIIAGIVLVSCGPKLEVEEKTTVEEKWGIIEGRIMASGATASDERPLPNVLSEREALLKTVDLAIAEGVLDSTSRIYQDHPNLLNAKIETPILVYDAKSGEPWVYELNAVDDNGIYLAGVGISAAANISDKEFQFGYGFALTSSHFITKREAVDLIKSQFSDGRTSEPIAIRGLRLEGNPFSHQERFWYFTVDDGGSRSLGGDSDEYVIAAGIAGYGNIPGGMSNRAAINHRGDTYLDGYRMAKLDTPIRLFDKLNTARTAGGASFSTNTTPVKPVNFTPAPLK